MKRSEVRAGPRLPGTTGDDLLTTAEAAQIAGVGTTSVKRWADLNLLPCVRTGGAHRRFRREDLKPFLAQHGSRDPWVAQLR